MFSPNVLNLIKSSVYGVGASRIDLAAGQSLFAAGKLSTIPPPLIAGTAFVVGDRVLMTNRHVLDQLNDKQFDGRRLLAFYGDSQDGETGTAEYVTKYAMGLLSKAPTLRQVYEIGEDLAVVLLKDSLQGHSPVQTMASEARVEVGEPIAICGYPWGNALLDGFPDPTMQRMGPVVTFGHIAAIAPFGGLALDRLSYIIADINSAPGMSGSPAFLSDGTCVGVHFGGHTVQIEDRNLKQHRLPQGLGYILPIDSAKVSLLLRNLQQDLDNPAVFK